MPGFKKLFSCVSANNHDNKASKRKGKGRTLAIGTPERAVAKDNVDLSAGIGPLSGRGKIDIDQDYPMFRSHELALQTAVTYTIDDKNNKSENPVNKLTKISSLFQFANGSQLNNINAGKDVDVVNIRNADSGSAAVRIDFSDVTESHPILVTTGNLSGCTVLFGADDDAFYAFHSGKTDTDESSWNTAKEGVINLYRTYQTLTGDHGDLAEPEDRDNHNPQLAEIIERLGSGITVYNNKGREYPTGRHGNRIEYNTEDEEGGLALALIRRSEEGINIQAIAHRTSTVKEIPEAEKKPITLK